MHSEMAHIAERHRRTGRVAFVSLLGFLFPVGRERGVAQLLVGLPVGEEFAIDRLGATVLFAPFIFIWRVGAAANGRELAVSVAILAKNRWNAPHNPEFA